MYQNVIVDGADAREFLQAQLTQDLELLEGAGSLRAAWCNAKGRVIVTMRLVADGGRLGMIVPAPAAADLVQRISVFRLRAKVVFSIAAGDWTCKAIDSPQVFETLAGAGLLPARGTGGACVAAGVTAADLGTPERVVEVFGDRASLAAAGLEQVPSLSDAAWREARIRAGLPDIGTAGAANHTPHMLNLDLLGFVSFDKGCYPGQEIVARTEHLGRSRRRLGAWRCDAAVAAGDRVVHDGRDVGEVVNAAPKTFLAVTPLEIHAESVTVNDSPAAPLPLPYEIPTG